ncbi:uncharacterized protein Dmoj_GI11057 [Drosophila mojavensis]|uniref:Tudor domain-containing protein n=2 Tax=Drosophila mojavensis TaxID=7230 RepID=B4L7T0_DROMO|nr:uncharacterized protein Dmoj_GI11057 [Drosophila mojavensis]
MMDSDAEVEPDSTTAHTNPFHADEMDEEPKEEQEDVNNSEEPNAENQMNNFMHLVEARAAVPRFAVSDEVFNVDKPSQAVCLGTELSRPQIWSNFKLGDMLKIHVTEAYSPFQFWFHIAEGPYDINLLGHLSFQLTKFYNPLRRATWQLPKYFFKRGYLCAAYNQFTWRRARIIREPEPNDEGVKVYLVDYGRVLEARAKDLFFMHIRFTEHPPLLMRGTLTDVYPLDLHWPAAATLKFRELVNNEPLHATIKDIDHGDCILFVNIYTGSTTISDLLIEAQLAGRSQNYSAEMRAENCGRRLRYLRERLPTFDMLETDVFQPSEEFEEQFDNIIYMPTFFQQFEMPKMVNPFRHDLQKALTEWLSKFKCEELCWRKVVDDSNEKIKEEKQNHVEQSNNNVANDSDELSV